MIIIAYVLYLSVYGGGASMFLVVGGIGEAMTEAYILLERWG